MRFLVLRIITLLMAGSLFCCIGAMEEIQRFLEKMRIEEAIKKKTFHEKVLRNASTDASFDEIAIDYCKKNSNTRIAIIWPRAQEKAEHMKEMLCACGPILYEKKFELFNDGPSNVFKTAQPKETDENIAKWIKDYVPADMPMPYHFRVIMFETDKPLEQIVAIKKKIRTDVGIDWCSIHIDDNHDESLELAALFFVHNPENIFQVLMSKLSKYESRPPLLGHYDVQSPVDVAKELAKVGGDLDKRTSSGFSLLHMAADDDEAGLAEALAKRGAKVDIEASNGDTPVLIAAQSGYTKKLRKFLEMGADINRKGSCGDTPLIRAAHHGQIDAVRLLLASGADVHQKDDSGRTALANVVSCCYKDEEQPKIVEELLAAGAHIDERDRADKDVLMNAAYSDQNLPAFKIILARAKNINAKDFRGGTPLFLAVEGVEHTTYSKEDDKRGCYQEAEEKVVLLIQAGALLNVKTTEGYSPLVEACKRGYQGIAKIFIDAGADLFIEQWDDIPLDWAVHNYHEDIITQLLKKHSHITPAKNYLYEALCKKVAKEISDNDEKVCKIAKILINAGALVNKDMVDIDQLKGVCLKRGLTTTQEILNNVAKKCSSANH